MEKYPNINKVEGSVPLSKVEEKLDQGRKEARGEFELTEIAPTDDELRIIDTVSSGLRVMFERVYKIDCKEILKNKNSHCERRDSGKIWARNAPIPFWRYLYGTVICPRIKNCLCESLSS